MEMFRVAIGLLLLEQNEKTLDAFFEDNEVTRIALYGMGALGCRAYDALLKTKVEVVCAFDRAAQCFSPENELTIYLPKKILAFDDDEKPDLIVVTSQRYYYDIKEEWEDKTDIPMISIGEIVEYCVVGEDLERIKKY